jgi:hypothetical protein
LGTAGVRQQPFHQREHQPRRRRDEGGDWGEAEHARRFRPLRPRPERDIVRAVDGDRRRLARRQFFRVRLDKDAVGAAIRKNLQEPAEAFSFLGRRVDPLPFLDDGSEEVAASGVNRHRPPQHGRR